MDYMAAVIELLQQVRTAEQEAIEHAAQAIAGAIEANHLLYVFGPTHAGILAQELCYRAGGLVPVNPIFPPGLTADVRPITLTSQLERLPGYGAQIIAQTAIEAGDVLIVHSVSGRNAVAVEVAQGAKQRGAFLIVVTSLEYSRSVPPRVPGTPRLYEVADLVLDNHAPIGDALVKIQGLSQKVGSASTISGVAILNAVVARVAELLIERTGDAPIFKSANLDGGDEHNQRWMERYRGRLTYL
jgi:uncharacterized phosphosugar-binding protein